MRISDWSSDVCSSDLIDECHCTGFLGDTGRGAAEVHGVMDKIDIFTGTLGKALGGALGGFTTGRKEVIELLRQRSRPYLFSNSLPPHVVAAAIKVFDMLASAGELREKLKENTRYFREQMTAAGFDRSEEHTSELQSLMRISYAVF